MAFGHISLMTNGLKKEIDYWVRDLLVLWWESSVSQKQEENKISLSLKFYLAGRPNNCTMCHKRREHEEWRSA